MGLKEQDIVFTTTDENGNKVLQMPITRYENVEGILDFVYPVGSLYWSKNAADPSTLFGGSWERVKDTFILAAGDSYEAGSTGGEASHTLTADEMPSHSHTGSASSEGIPDHIHAVGYNNSNNAGTWIATSATGTYISDVTLDSKASYRRHWNGSGSTNTLQSVGTESGAYQANIGTSKAIAADGETTGNHSHTLSITSAGGGMAHNNMPPYATYYCWERTA